MRSKTASTESFSDARLVATGIRKRRSRIDVSRSPPTFFATTTEGGA